MIARAELNELAQEWGLAEHVIEKDYVIGWLLWGIGNEPDLSAAWAFKGGTCLKKCYIETYRFSEDLDFSVLPNGPLYPKELGAILSRVLDQVADESGINFADRPPMLKQHGAWPSVEGRVYYRGPNQTRNVASIKLDLLGNETVLRPTVLRPISHPYSDAFPPPEQVRCYSFEELFAEKLRALGERCRSRDLYDVINLYRRRDLHIHAELIWDVLQQKCAAKGLSSPTLASLESSPNRMEVESEWENMLKHQLPALPPFEHYWNELGDVFDWLAGVPKLSILERMPSLEGEDETWTPPPTIWTWGLGQPLEVVRFAGANHLCVELGYGGNTRIIEPYSLRRSRAGSTLLHAIRHDSGQHRSYRVDRIESIRVTTQPFRPRYLIEFAQTDPISAPPSQPRTVAAFTHPRRPEYVVECSICGRQFKRITSDTNLRPHKDTRGYLCSGRTGTYVDTIY